MKFLKKLGSILLVILVIACIFAVVIALNWEKFSAMPEQMQQAQQEQDRQTALLEANKEITYLLALARDHFENENLVEFSVSEIYTDTGVRSKAFIEKNAADREQELMRSTRISYTGDNKVYEDYTQISSKTFDWPDMRSSNDSWIRYRTPDLGDFLPRLYLDGQSYSLAFDTWYSYDGWFSDQFGTPNSMMPFGIMTAQVTGYEEVGTEEIRGEQTTHYIVTHKPMMQLPQALDMQYTHPEAARLCSPMEYFSTAIDQKIIDNHPQLYEDFIALMNARWYEDNTTHVWLTDDGRLLRICYDYTFETYEGYFLQGMDYEYIEASLVTYSYEEGADGQYVEVTQPSDFATLRPISRLVDISYGADVEPIVIPENCLDLRNTEIAQAAAEAAANESVNSAPEAVAPETTPG